MRKDIIRMGDFMEGLRDPISDAMKLISANRIWQLIEAGEVFGIIHGYSPLADLKTNVTSQAMLDEEISKRTDGYEIFTVGYNYHGDGEPLNTDMELFFVPGIELEDLLELGRAFDQETVIYGSRMAINSYNVQTGKLAKSMCLADLMCSFCCVMLNPGSFR